MAANHQVTSSARSLFNDNNHDIAHLSQHHHKALNNYPTTTDTPQFLQAADHTSTKINNSQLHPIATQGQCSEFEDYCNDYSLAQHCQDFEDYANSFDFQQFMMSDGWQSHNFRCSNVGNFPDSDPCQACDNYDNLSDCEDCNFSCFSETSFHGSDDDQLFLLELLLKPDGTSLSPNEIDEIQVIIELGHIYGNIDPKICEKLFQKFPELAMSSHPNPLQTEPTHDPPAQHSNSSSNTPTTVPEKPTQDTQFQLSKSRSNTQEHKQLEAQVHGIYSLQPKLPAAANQCLFPILTDECLAQPINKIQCWIYLSQPYV